MVLNYNFKFKTKLATRLVKFVDKFKKNVFPVGYFHRGALYSETFVVCALMDLMKIDLLLESGIAYGRSTEIFSKYGIKSIKSVDIAHIKIYSKEQNEKVWNETKDRLSKYDNLKLFKGNSKSILPKLIKQNSKKRIGVVVDGPKGIHAVNLASECYKHSCVKFVAIHDQVNDKSIMKRHFKNYFATTEKWYRELVGDLDNDDIDSLNEMQNERKYEYDFSGFGMGVSIKTEELQELIKG